MTTDLYACDGTSMKAEIDGLLSGRDTSCAVLCDMERPSAPIVFVTPTFCRLTGYRFEEAVGRNCNFLQGPDTDARDVEEIRDALAERRQVSLEILNYTKRGEEMLNSLHLSPCFDGGGRLVRYLAYQTFCARAEDAPCRVILPRSGFSVSLRRYSKGGFHAGYRPGGTPPSPAHPS